MTDFNMQEALESLRTEMQVDRLAIQKSINDGVGKVMDKLDSHTQSINNLDHRVTSVETKQNILGGVLAIMGTGFVGMLSRLFLGK